MIALLLAISTLAPASETAYGCYEPVCRSPYADLARLTFRDMRKHGFTTGTVSGNADLHFGPTHAIGLARQLDLMIEEGVARKDRPMLCLSSDPKDIVAAKGFSAYPNEWPELVCGNVDEPNQTQIGSVRQISTEARAVNLRNGTALAGYILYWPTESPSDGVIADWIDEWWVLASTWQTDLYRKAFEQTAGLNAYWAYPREVARDYYVAGPWCWRWNPRTFYFWCWNHSGLTCYLPNGKFQLDKGDEFSLSHQSVHGPVDTPSLLAVEQAIKDHGLLDKLKDSGKGGQWLKDLWDSVPVCMPPPPKPVPEWDRTKIMREVRRRLR